MTSVAKTLLRVLAVSAALAFAGSPQANAQSPPGLGLLDHYKVYEFQGPQIPPITVELHDQFMVAPYVVQGPFFFSPPAQKNQEPIHDPRVHFSWYGISSPALEPQFDVVVHNQFGSFNVRTGRASHLLVPTLKNEPVHPPPFPQLPVDHYKCYQAEGGRPDNVTVTVITQFGTEVVEIGPPQWLCNPTKKIHAGVLTPIVNPTDHLVCYEIHPSQTLGASIVRQDQFGPGDGFLTFNRWLCVPSLKEHPTGTEGVTWSRVRALYR